MFHGRLLGNSWANVTTLAPYLPTPGDLAIQR